MNDEVRHDGVVQSIDGGHVKVRINQTSACLHCKIAGHCNSADSKEKIIDVWTKNASKYAVGQTVTVVMGGKMGLKAVLYAFVVPVVLASIAIFVVLQMTSSDGIYPMAEPYDQGIAALAGLLTFVVYYTGLYFFRGHLEGKFQFRIE